MVAVETIATFKEKKAQQDKCAHTEVLILESERIWTMHSGARRGLPKDQDPQALTSLLSLFGRTLLPTKG